MTLKRGTKRFYQTAAAEEIADGYAVTLDGKPIKTPAGKALVLDQRLAEAIANEWDSQGAFIEPDTMPLTRYANTVVDRVEPRRAEVAEELAKFANNDLLCYREAMASELMRRQAAAWDPWLAWAADRYGAELAVGQGVTHLEQPAEAVEALRRAIAEHDPHRLAVLHTAITITGSAVLGLAFVSGELSAEGAFAAAHVDELFQEERWGRDKEAHLARTRRLSELEAGGSYLSLLPARG